MSYQSFKEKYNINANEQQEAAIRQVEGPVLLLAVPGSGKTTVIVGRTGYMIIEKHINAENILVITFTTAAAKEMQERFCKKFSMDTYPHFATINSFCLSVIRYCEKYKGFRRPSLVPNNLSVIRDIIISLTGEYPEEPFVRFCNSAIGYIKNNMEENNCFKKVEKDPNYDGALALKVYDRYLKYMQANDLMDFDDQLIFAWQLLNKYPDVLTAFQEHYRYLSVDEAQDTSYIQHKIIRLLASRYHNIFMVGDEDQSIYEFRGAYPEALLDFKNCYPGARELFMSVNYRSTGNIVDSAESFICQNKTRTKKYMKTQNPEGEVVENHQVMSVETQYRHILELVKKKKQGETFAVLSRDNAALMPLITLFYKEGISFNCRDDVAPFIYSFEVSDCLNFLRLGLDKRNIAAFSKIYYKLGLYLKKSDYEAVEKLCLMNPEKDIVSILKGNLKIRKKKSLDNFIRALENVKKVPPKQAIMQFTERTGYESYLNEKNQGSGLHQKLYALLAIAQETKTAEELLNVMDDLENRRKMRFGSDITLTTMHSAKGMEFDTVVIINAIQNILPSYESIENNDYESDVRLFYVAATRAKRKLIFITSSRWYSKDISPSKFVARFINKKYENKSTGNIKRPASKISKPDKISINRKSIIYSNVYPEGKRVRHKTFGDGSIINCENGVLKISFDKCGEKSLGAQVVYENSLLTLI